MMDGDPHNVNESQIKLTREWDNVDVEEATTTLVNIAEKLTSEPVNLDVQGAAVPVVLNRSEEDVLHQPMPFPFFNNAPIPVPIQVYMYPQDAAYFFMDHRPFPCNAIVCAPMTIQPDQNNPIPLAAEPVYPVNMPFGAYHLEPLEGGWLLPPNQWVNHQNQGCLMENKEFGCTPQMMQKERESLNHNWNQVSDRRTQQQENNISQNQNVAVDINCPPFYGCNGQFNSGSVGYCGFENRNVGAISFPVPFEGPFPIQNSLGAPHYYNPVSMQFDEIPYNNNQNRLFGARRKSKKRKSIRQERVEQKCSPVSVSPVSLQSVVQIVEAIGDLKTQDNGVSEQVTEQQVMVTDQLTLPAEMWTNNLKIQNYGMADEITEMITSPVVTVVSQQSIEQEEAMNRDQILLQNEFIPDITAQQKDVIHDIDVIPDILAMKNQYLGEHYPKKQKDLTVQKQRNSSQETTKSSSPSLQEMADTEADQKPQLGKSKNILDSPESQKTLQDACSLPVFKSSYYRRQKTDRRGGCRFCWGFETAEFSSSHTIMDIRGIITCPVLRTYVCPICKATGDQAHTRRYCPYIRK